MWYVAELGHIWYLVFCNSKSVEQRCQICWRCRLPQASLYHVRMSRIPFLRKNLQQIDSHYFFVQKISPSRWKCLADTKRQRTVSCHLIATPGVIYTIPKVYTVHPTSSKQLKVGIPTLRQNLRPLSITMLFSSLHFSQAWGPSGSASWQTSVAGWLQWVVKKWLNPTWQELETYFEKCSVVDLWCHTCWL